MFDANLIVPLIRMLATAEYDIKKEAAWALSNATSGGTADQIRGLVDAGCIKPLCDTLTVNDTRIIIVALEGLENILKVCQGGEDDRPCRQHDGICVLTQFVSYVCLRLASRLRKCLVAMV